MSISFLRSLREARESIPVESEDSTELPGTTSASHLPQTDVSRDGGFRFRSSEFLNVCQELLKVS